MKKTQKKYSSHRKNFTKKINKYTQQGGDGDLKGSEFYEGFIATRIKFFEPELDLSGEEDNILGAINEGYQKAHTQVTKFNPFLNIKQYENELQLSPKYSNFSQNLSQVTTEESYISFAMVHGMIAPQDTNTFNKVPDNTIICFIAPVDKLSSEILATNLDFYSEFNELTKKKYLKLFQDNMKLRNQKIEVDRRTGHYNPLIDSMWYFPGQVYPEVEMSCELNEMETSQRDNWGFKFLALKNSDPIVSDHPDPTGEFLDKNNLISKLKTDPGKPEDWNSYFSDLVNHHHSVLNPRKDKIKLVFTIFCRPISDTYDIASVRQIFLTEMYFMEYNRANIFETKEKEYQKPPDEESIFKGRFIFDSFKIYLLYHKNFDQLKEGLEFKNQNLSGQVPTLQKLFGDDKTNLSQFYQYFITASEDQLIDNYIYISLFSFNKILQLFIRIKKYAGGEKLLKVFCTNLIKYAFFYLTNTIKKIFMAAYLHINYLPDSIEVYHEEMTELLESITTFENIIVENSGFYELLISNYLTQFNIKYNPSLPIKHMFVFKNDSIEFPPGIGLPSFNIHTLYIKTDTDEVKIINALQKLRLRNNITNFIIACEKIPPTNVGMLFGKIKQLIILNNDGNLVIDSLLKMYPNVEDLQIKFPNKTFKKLRNRIINTSVRFLKLENTKYYLANYDKFLRLTKLELIHLDTPPDEKLTLDNRPILKEVIIRDCTFQIMTIKSKNLKLLEISNTRNFNTEIILGGFCETLVLEDIAPKREGELIEIETGKKFKVNTCKISHCIISSLNTNNFLAQLNLKKSKSKKYPQNTLILSFNTFNWISDATRNKVKKTILGICNKFKNVEIEMLFSSNQSPIQAQGTNSLLKFTPDDFRKLSLKKFDSFKISRHNLDIPAVTSQRNIQFLNCPNFNIIN